MTTVAIWAFYCITRVGDSTYLPGAPNAAHIVRNISDELLECITDPAPNNSTNTAGQYGWVGGTDPGTGISKLEVCDACETHAAQRDATFSDGLTVAWYFDKVTKKCVAPGTGVTPTAISQNPVYSSQGGPVIPNPVIWLIFWGTTWGSQTTLKNSIIDLVQNKLLGTDKGWWDTARTDYGNFATPLWGGSVTLNQNIPATPSNYNTNHIVAAMDAMVLAAPGNGLPTAAASTFISQGVTCSNNIYVLVPDPTWIAANPDTGAGVGYGWEAYHWTRSYNYTFTDPPPPAGSPPPTTPPSPPSHVDASGLGANTIDGLLSTAWTANTVGALNPYITWNLGFPLEINTLKIDFLDGDKKTYFFDIDWSVDNTTWNNIAPQGSGTSWKSSGKTAGFESIVFNSIVAQYIRLTGHGNNSGVSGPGAATVNTTLQVPFTVIQTGDNPGGTTAAYITREILDEMLESITNPITSGTGADKGWTTSDGYEICDLCENHAGTTTATFADGLQVPFYFDKVTNKCVAPGAGTAAAISENPTYTNHGGPVNANPKIWLIFWGTTWGSQTTFKNAVIDYIQNKALGADSGFFATAKSDYGFNTPVWGGSATNSTTNPNSTSSVKVADAVRAIQDSITSGAVPNPTSSTFTSPLCSSIIYCVVPDLSWQAYNANDDTSFASAIHLSFQYTSTTTGGTPPPPPPPGGSPSPPPAATNNTFAIAEAQIWGPDIPSNFPPSGGTAPPPPPGQTGSWIWTGTDWVFVPTGGTSCCETTSTILTPSVPSPPSGTGAAAGTTGGTGTDTGTTGPVTAGAPPPLVNIFRDFTDSYNLGIETGDLCAADNPPGSPPLAQIYNSPVASVANYISMARAGSECQRVGEAVMTDASQLIGTAPRKVTITMKRIGTADGLVYCRIRDKTGAIVQEIDTYPAAAVGLNDTQLDFQNDGVQHVIQKGDIIWIEYDDPSAVDGNTYLMYKISDKDNYDAINSIFVKYTNKIVPDALTDLAAVISV